MANGNGQRRIKRYSDLTIDEAILRFSLGVVREPIFPPLREVEANDWLKTTIQKGFDLSLVSEKARSEFLVAPILVHLRELVDGRIGIFSGVRFDVDPQAGLKGVCDFIITAKPTVPILLAPALVIVEAKKHDIEEGLGQCAGEMIAARLFNQRHDSETENMFGCVTNGEAWQFLKLDRQNTLTIDNSRVFLSQLPLLLGRLLWIVEEGLKQFADKEPK